MQSAILVSRCCDDRYFNPRTFSDVRFQFENVRGGATAFRSAYLYELRLNFIMLDGIIFRSAQTAFR